MTGKTILLTGATGFLGSEVLGLLLGEGFNVASLVRPTSISRVASEFRHHSNHSIIAFDLVEDALDLDSRISFPIDAIVHCAALPKLGGVSLRQMVKVHLGPARLLAKFAVDRKIGKFLHVSTAFVGADCDGLLGEKQASLETTCNFYERTKTQVEYILNGISPSGLEIIRPAVIFSKPEDGISALALSPLGQFFQALEKNHGAQCNIAADPSLNIGCIYRDDVARFILHRLLSKNETETPYWNLVKPSKATHSVFGEILEQTGLVKGIRFINGGGSPLFQPWEKYLCQERKWVVDRTYTEFERMGTSMAPFDSRTFRELAALWKAESHQRKVA